MQGDMHEQNDSIHQYLTALMMICMTLSCASGKDSNGLQAACFLRLSGIKGRVSICNSVFFLTWPGIRQHFLIKG